jgi:iron complex outermembrane receptor protein
MRTCFFIWILGISCVQAQEPDSIFPYQTLPDVVVKELRVVEISNDYPTSSLNDILFHQSGIAIKQNGTGGLSTPNVRGSSASQTSILWNGVELRSPMNGAFDLQLIPAFFIDRIRLNPGNANSTLTPSIGGQILMDNVLSDYSFRSEIQYSNLENYSVGMDFINREETHFLRTRIYTSLRSDAFKFKNDFIPGNNIQVQNDNDFIQYGVLNEGGFSKGRNNFDYKLFYVSTDRHLAPVATLENSRSYQDDENFIGKLKWTHSTTNSYQLLDASISLESIFFRDSIINVFARNESTSYSTRYKFDHRINDDLSFSFGMLNKYDRANTSNYGFIDDNTLLGSIQLNYEPRWNRNFELTGLLKRQFFESQNPLLFGVVLEYNVPRLEIIGSQVEMRDYFLRVAIAQS